MNKKTIIVGLCIIFVLNVSVISPGFTGSIQDQMIPGMLTTDAPYYTYVQNNTESTTTRLAYSPPEITGAIGQWIEQIDEEMVLYYIQNLVDFGPRVTGSTACDEAGTYIYEEFENLGLDVRYHYWTSGSLSGKNVEATLEGLNQTSDKIFIVLGHYDSVSGSPGADDNAGGTTAALAAAEVLRQYRFQHTIRFLTVDGEEQGLHGSAKYAEEAANNGDNIIAALNADMIGYAPTQEAGSYVNIYTNTDSNWIYEYTNDISIAYASILNDLQPIDAGYIPNSDHASFIEQGYHAALYHEYVFNPYYHSPDDIIAHMNMTYDAMVTRLIVAALAELAEPIIYEHDLMVSDLVIPSVVPHGITQTVQATITNIGNNTETDIIVDFLVNDTVLNSTTIASLDTFDSTLVNFSWDPDYGTFLVAIASQPVPGEEDLSNNQVNKTVEVIPAPFIQVTPDSLGFMAPTNAVDSESILIENLVSAEAVLDYSISFAGDLGGGWLSSYPESGSVDVGSGVLVNITVNTTGLDEGSYQGYVIVSSNDIITPVVMVPVDLTVVYGHDMRVVSINSPVGTVPFGEYVVNATVQNLGFYPQSDVVVNCSIFEGGIGGVVLDEDFSSYPDDWTITHTSGTAWSWSSTNQWMYNMYSWGTVNSGYLDSPVLDCSGKTGIHLSFWHHWKADYAGYDQDGYVRGSIDGGETFPYLIDSFHAPNVDEGVKEYDISSWADGQSSVVIRFDVYNDWNYYWRIDDVNVSAEITGPLVYYAEESVSLDAYESMDVLFSPSWLATGGTYGIQVTTLLEGDEYPGNDVVSDVVFVEGPNLAFEPDYFDFGLMMANTTDSTSLAIWNDNVGTLSYALSGTCDWVSLSSDGGSVDEGEVDTIMVYVNTTGLEASMVHTCDINISSDGGDGVFTVSVFVVDDTTEFLDIEQDLSDRGFRMMPGWDAAQEFISSYPTLSRVELYMTTWNNPVHPIPVEIRKDDPIGDVVFSSVIYPADVTETFPEWGWVSVDVGAISVEVGETYVIVLRSNDDDDDFNHLMWGVYTSFGIPGPYPDGNMLFRKLGFPTWMPIWDFDSAFKTYGYE